MTRAVEIYDTTLRDGTQAEGISFGVEERVRVAERLDDLGIAYLEGGWPGSNPTSVEFFERIRGRRWKNLKVAAFGSTRHAKKRAEADENLRALLQVGTPVVTIFGKSWDLHVRDALRVSPDQNLAMIEDSVRFLKANGREVIYDAEHFFDGFVANRAYALATLAAAERGGADRLVLCDTNGGSIPSRIRDVVREVRGLVRTPIGIHSHNDAGCGVANAIAAVEEGAVHVQGTMNGIGERCGNCDLVPIIAGLELKLGIRTIGAENLRKLGQAARFVAEAANVIFDERAPYVGLSAFAHKGGIHVSAVERNPACYEHVDPATVGNRRRVLVSDQSGRSNLVWKIREMGLAIAEDDPTIPAILRALKDLEARGYAFEAAEASFALLVDRLAGRAAPAFEAAEWRVLSERVHGENFVLATVKVKVAGKEEHAVAEGDGPVNALDNALRKAIEDFYPEVRQMHLVDYSVRVLDAAAATAAAVRVLILSTDGKETWGTVGVDENVVEASWIALVDSFEYFLSRRRRPAAPRPPHAPAGRRRKTPARR